jgi:hypothetical protein
MKDWEKDFVGRIFFALAVGGVVGAILIILLKVVAKYLLG